MLTYTEFIFDSKAWSVCIKEVHNEQQSHPSSHHPLQHPPLGQTQVSDVSLQRCTAMSIKIK